MVAMGGCGRVGSVLCAHWLPPIALTSPVLPFMRVTERLENRPDSFGAVGDIRTGRNRSTRAPLIPVRAS